MNKRYTVTITLTRKISKRLDKLVHAYNHNPANIKPITRAELAFKYLVTSINSQI